MKRNEIDFHEFEQLKTDLRRKREIPQWFKKRFIVDYDDQREIVTDLTSFYKVEEKTELLASPRVKAAKRKLEEMREEGKLDPGIVAAISVRLRLLSVQVLLPTECSLQWDPGDLLYRTIQERVVASLTMFLLYAVNEMLVVAEQGDVPIYVGCRGPPWKEKVPWSPLN